MEPRQAGFILPFTLIVIALLTLLSVGLSQMARLQLRQTTMQKQQFQGYIDTQNANQAAIFRLLSETPGPRAFGQGKESTPIDGRPVRLARSVCRIQDVAGLFSLGLYDEGRFRRLLSNLTDARIATQLAARLGDWIDEDNQARYQGMEIAGYRALGLNTVPRNGPLRSMDELLEIPGMTAALYNGQPDSNLPGLRDLLTAGGPGWFNAAAAPSIVLGSYLNFSPGELAAVEQARQDGNWQEFNRLVRSAGVGNWEMPPSTPSRQFRISCQTPQGFRGRSQVQLKMASEPLYEVLLWQYPDYERL